MTPFLQPHAPFCAHNTRGWAQSFLYQDDVLTLLKSLEQRRVSYFPVLEDGTPLLLPSAEFSRRMGGKASDIPILVLGSDNPTGLWEAILLWCHRHLTLRWAHLLLALRQAVHSGADPDRLLTLPLPWGELRKDSSSIDSLADLLVQVGKSGLHWDRFMLDSLSLWREEERDILLFWSSRLRFSRTQTLQFWDGMAQLRMTPDRMCHFHRSISQGAPIEDAAGFLHHLSFFLHPRQTRRLQDLQRGLEKIMLPGNMSVKLDGDDPNLPIQVHLSLRNLEHLEPLFSVIQPEP